MVGHMVEHMVKVTNVGSTIIGVNMYIDKLYIVNKDIRSKVDTSQG